MGNDGGSIPDRRDLVKNKPKAEQADKNNQTIAAWFFCALSKRPLQEPIVSCALGKLYNKDALLEYLLDKSAYGDGQEICGHIRSLKEVKTLRLTPNPARPSPDSPDTAKKRSAYICPLTLKEMSGTLPFVYLATCGCVLSAAGLKAVSSPSPSSSTTPPPSDDDQSPPSEPKQSCPQCTVPYSKDDVMTINPGPDEQEKMRDRMLAAKAKVKSSKKRKLPTESAPVLSEGHQDSEEISAKRSKPSAEKGPVAPAPMINPSVSSVARKVTEQLAEEEKKRKANMSSAVASLYAPKNGRKVKETFLTMNTFTRYA